MRPRSVGSVRGSAPARARARARIGLAIVCVLILSTAAGLGIARSTASAGVSNVVGNGFTVTPGDLAFILKQIKIAEHHAATQTAAQSLRHAGRPWAGSDSGRDQFVRPPDRRRVV